MKSSKLQVAIDIIETWIEVSKTNIPGLNSHSLAYALKLLKEILNHATDQD